MRPRYYAPGGSPCLGCGDRYVDENGRSCHDRCDKYTAYSDKCKQMNDKRLASYETDPRYTTNRKHSMNVFVKSMNKSRNQHKQND